MAVTGTNAGAYILTVSGGSCQPILVISTNGSSGGTAGGFVAASANPLSTRNELVLEWSTAALGWQLECIDDLNTAPLGWRALINVPVVIDSKLAVTAPLDGTNRFFRLRKR